MHTLESTHGRHRRPDGIRGHATIVFYESYGHLNDNEALKLACGRLIESRIHGDRLEVMGVANLSGLGASPVRRFVRGAVTRVARHYGVELWMDFDGVLQRAPFALGEESSVAVLAPDGEVLFRAHGRLDDTNAFYRALGEALARAAARAA